jgi:NAD(P)-dependent dehydrogenase (short-subunit alcohol dehydrogenase family)
MRLEGKVAIVTGGGKGIGRDIAIGLSQEGASVVICSRTKADLDITVSKIEYKGGSAFAIAKDLTSSFHPEWEG